MAESFHPTTYSAKRCLSLSLLGLILVVVIAQARLALGLFGNGAGIKNDGVIHSRSLCMPTHHLGFIGVQAAAERNQLWLIFFHSADLAVFMHFRQTIHAHKNLAFFMSYKL